MSLLTKKYAQYICISMLIMLGCPVHAQILGATSPWSIGFDAGLISNAHFGDSIAQANKDAVQSTFDGSAVDDTPKCIKAGRLYAQRSLSPRWALELGYLEAQRLDIAYSGVSARGLPWSGQTSSALTALDALVILSGAKGSVLENFFIKTGVQAARLDRGSSLFAAGLTAAEQAKDFGYGAVLGLGLRVRYSERVDAVVTYTYMNKIAGQTDLSAQATSVGVSYKF